jgi:hypothetical protein
VNNKCAECEDPTDFFSKKFKKYLCKDCYKELRWGIVIPGKLFHQTLEYNRKYKTGGRSTPEEEGDSPFNHNATKVREE